MQGNRAFTRTRKPVWGDESVASVEWNVSRTPVDRDHNSANRFGLREYLARKAEIASALSETHQELESQRRNYSRRVNGLIKLKEKGLICVENWSEETDFIMNVKSKQTKRSKNYEHFTMKKQIKFEGYNLTNIVSATRKRSEYCEQTLQANSRITGSREFYSQKTENFTILVQRAVHRNHRFLPAAIRNCRQSHGILCVIQETFLETPQLEKDLPQLYSKIRVSHLLRIVEWDLSRAKRTWDRGEKEWASRFFKSCSVLLKGSWFILPISEMHLGKFPDPMEFQSWKVNFKTEVCSKKNRFSQLRYSWCNHCVCIEWRSFSTGMCISEKE